MASMTTSLRVVLLSINSMAIPRIGRILNQKGHRLVGVLSAPGPKIRRTDDYLEIAQHASPGLDVIISNYRSRWADYLRPLKPDLFWVAGFNWKIPADVLEVPRLGTINGHDALLPKYRGRNATGWALRNDDHDYGVTYHYMTPNFDDGPILGQRRVPFSDQDDFQEDIFPRFWATADEIISDVLDKVAVGDPGTPQDESQVTYAGGAFEPEWRFIDWSKPARDIFIQVRSWYGARDVPLGAFGEIDGETMLITKTKLVDEASAGRPPGTVLHANSNGILIQCGDRPLLLRELQPAEVKEIQPITAIAQ